VTILSMTDLPKVLADPKARSGRRAKLHEPHIAPLTAYVEALRHEVGPSAAIPDFDPWDGGVDAEILYLLEAPGPQAVASGFISRDNPDETAKNFFQLNQQSGISRKRTITWNILSTNSTSDASFHGSLHLFDVTGLPTLVKGGFGRAVESDDGEIPSAGHRGEPVAFLGRGRFRPEIEVRAAVGVLRGLQAKSGRPLTLC
jgi:hypothetical protein